MADEALTLPDGTVIPADKVWVHNLCENYLGEIRDLRARLATAEAEREHDHAIAEAGRAFFDAFVQTNGQAFPWMPQDLLTALVEDYDRRRAPSTGGTP